MITIARTPDEERHLLDDKRFPVRVGDTLETRIGRVLLTGVEFDSEDDRAVRVFVSLSDASDYHTYRVRAAELCSFTVVDGPDLETRRKSRMIGQGGWMFHGVGMLDVECEIRVMIVPPGGERMETSMRIRFDVTDSPADVVVPPKSSGIEPPVQGTLLLGATKAQALRIASDLLRRVAESKSERIEVALLGCVSEAPKILRGGG